MTRNAYLEEFEDHPVTEVEPHAQIPIRLDVPQMKVDPIYLKDLPPHRLDVSVEAVVTAGDVTERGILCCSEW